MSGETAAAAPPTIDKNVLGEREHLAPPERDRREVAVGVLIDRYQKAVRKDGTPDNDPTASGFYSAVDMGNLSQEDIGNDGLDCPTESSDQGEPMRLRLQNPDMEGVVAKIVSRENDTYTVVIQAADGGVHTRPGVPTRDIRLANLVAEREKILSGLADDPDAKAVVEAYIDSIDWTKSDDDKTKVDDETVKRTGESLRMMSMEDAKSVVAIIAQDNETVKDRLTALDGRLVLDSSDVRDLLEGVDPEYIENKKNEAQSSWSLLRTEREEAETAKKAAEDAKAAAETAKAAATEQDAISAEQAKIDAEDAKIKAAETEINDLNSKIDPAKNTYDVLQKANKALAEAQDTPEAEAGSPLAVANGALDVQIDNLQRALQKLPKPDPRTGRTEADVQRENAEYMLAQLERARDVSEGRLMLFAKANALQGLKNYAKGGFAEQEADAAIRQLSEGLSKERKAFVEFLKEKGVSDKVLKMASDPSKLGELILQPEVMRLPGISKELFGTNAADAQGVLNDFINNAVKDPSRRKQMREKLGAKTKDTMWALLIALAIGLGEAVMAGTEMAGAATKGR